MDIDATANGGGGEWIRRLRRRKGLNQSQLADLVGLDQTTISSYERGAREVSLHTVRAIGRALGASSADWLELMGETSDEDVVALARRIIELEGGR